MVEGYRISSNSEEIDLDAIHAFISRSYWAKNIPLDVQKRAIKNSLCFGVFVNHIDQVGFARLITDRAMSDAHGLYQKYGFTQLNSPDIFLEHWNPNVYNSNNND